MERFIRENECTDINGWLKWWYERRSSIFQAFKSYKDPRCYQAEVIHACWVHRDRMGVSLLDACMFDVRDFLILEDQLKQFDGGSYSGGSDLNQKQRTERVKNSEKEAAIQFGRDLLNFGLKGSTPVEYCVTLDNDTANSPAKRANISFDKMLEKRKANAKTDSTSVKVRQ